MRAVWPGMTIDTLYMRLVALSYTNVYWYRREAWEVAELPEAPVAVQDW